MRPAPPRDAARGVAHGPSAATRLDPTKIDRLWMIFDGRRTEVCRTNPGFTEDLVVTIDSGALSEWHLGRLGWADGVRVGRISVDGPRGLAPALPRWNRLSGWAHLGIQPMGGLR